MYNFRQVAFQHLIFNPERRCHPQTSRSFGYSDSFLAGQDLFEEFAEGKRVTKEFPRITYADSMLKYGVDDIRLFYENDIRFLEQFPL